MAMNINLPVRQNEMLRTQPMQPGMLNINGPPFLGAPQPGQQQQQPSHMGMLPTNPNSAAAMGGLLMPPGGSASHNYQLQMQQAQAQRQAYMPQRAHATPGMNAAMGPGPSHVNGLGPNQLPTVGFQNQMMQQNGVRRVQSQPGPLNQAGGSMGVGMHAGQMMPGAGGLNGMGGMGMPPQIRQMPQQQQVGQMRLPQQLGGPSGMPSDLQMGIPRAPGMTNGPSYSPHIARTPSQNQTMPNIPQPPTLPQSHPGGMQQPSFPGGMPLGQHMHGQQQQSLRSSPHPSQQGPPGGMQAGMQGGPGSQAAASNRPDAMFNFANQQPQPNVQPGVARMTPGGVQVGYNPNSAPPNQQHGQNPQLSDLQQSLTGGALGTPRTQSGQSLLVTPVQTFQAMSNESLQNSYPMHQQGAPGNVPPRPPSQQQRHFQMQQQQQQQQQQQAMQQHMAIHRSPRQPEHLAHQMQVQRPQSQPQVPQGHSPQRAGPSNTPRTQHSQLPPANMPNRTPHMAPAQPQGPVPPPKPPTPAQQVNIASRPQQGPPSITSQAAPGPNASLPSSGPPTTAPEAGSSNQPPTQPPPPAIYAQPQRQVPVSFVFLCSSFEVWS